MPERAPDALDSNELLVAYTTTILERHDDPEAGRLIREMFAKNLNRPDLVGRGESRRNPTWPSPR